MIHAQAFDGRALLLLVGTILAVAYAVASGWLTRSPDHETDPDYVRPHDDTYQGRYERPPVAGQMVHIGSALGHVHWKDPADGHAD